MFGVAPRYSGGAWRQQGSSCSINLAFSTTMRMVGGMNEDARDYARQLLLWYDAVGVDEALCAESIDWLARGDAAPGTGFRIGGEGVTAPSPQVQSGTQERSASRLAPSRSAPAGRAADLAVGTRPTPAPPRQFATASPDVAVTSAREAARAAGSLDELEAALAAFEGCGLKATAKNLCFYRGQAEARVMLIGEAPGRDEDLAGKPFVGPAGRMLDKMLAAIGLGEDDVHITNSVYWRPPGNRTPSPLETQVCMPFLERQVELVAPEIVVVLGGAAAKLVLGVEDGIMRLRGKWREVAFAGARRRVMPTLHPAFLLRTPINKRLAWRDLLAIEAALEKR
jgi:uracil-DNA glycosylase family 4